MKRLFLPVIFLILAFTAVSVCQEKKETKEKKPVTQSVVKEVQAFHKVLHPLVHDALPDGDFGTIRKNLEKLLEEANAIQEAQVPKKLAGRQKEVEDTAEKLVSELKDLVSTKDIVDDATLEKLFNDMHETFEQLAEIVK